MTIAENEGLTPRHRAEPGRKSIMEYAILGSYRLVSPIRRLGPRPRSQSRKHVQARDVSETVIDAVVLLDLTRGFDPFVGS